MPSYILYFVLRLFVNYKCHKIYKNANICLSTNRGHIPEVPHGEYTFWPDRNTLTAN